MKERPPAFIDGSRALVTGATGGLGEAIARSLRRCRAQLTLTGRRADVLAPLAEELGARAIARDLSNRDELEHLVSEVGEIDLLVANAGLPAVGLITELGPEDVDRMLDVNLRAPIALAQGFAPAMIERRHGHMVFVASLAGKVTSPASAVYSATKFGLRGFALALRQDLRPHGVGVSVICPGFIRDGGMFAAAEVELPRGVGTRTPANVGSAVLDVVENNKAEVDVAPFSLRMGTRLAGLVPELSATTMRKVGSDRIATEFAEAQADAR